MLDFRELGSMRTHAKNVEWIKEGVMILRELAGNYDLSRVTVYFDETRKLSSAVTIQNGNQFFVVI